MSYNVVVDKDLILDTNARKIVRARNNSGGAVVPGDVVIYDTSVSYGTAFTTTTTGDDPKVMGMSLDSIPNGAAGRVLVGGMLDTSTLKVNGTTAIAAGDMLATYTTAKIAQKATAGKGGVFAIALEAYSTADSLGTIKAVFVPGSRSDASATVTYGTAAQMAADGIVATNAAGSTAAVARVDHAHTHTNDTPALVLSTSNAVGTAGKPLMVDATVAVFDATVPTIHVPGASAAAGTAAFAARRDHLHGANASSAPVDGSSLNASNTAGTNTDFSASDHTHKGKAKNDINIVFGTTDAAATASNLQYDTAETVDAMKWGLDETSRRLILMDYGDLGTDTTIAAATDPQLMFMDATAVDWFKISTTLTGGVLDVKTANNLTVQVNGTVEYTFDATNFIVAAANFIQFAGNNGITDSNANELLEFTAVAAATNGLLIKNATTGNPAILSAQGTGATANRGIRFEDSNGNAALILKSVASAVNTLNVQNQVTGSGLGSGAPVIEATGTDAVVGITFLPKSTGALYAGRLGAVGTPVYSFSGDEDTGVYSGGANNLDFSIGGVRYLSLQSAQVWLTANGSVGTPVLAINDADTGLYLVAANAIGFGANGIETMRHTAVNNVVVGASGTAHVTAGTKVLTVESGNAPSGVATTSSSIFASATVLRKIIADGTTSNIET